MIIKDALVVLALLATAVATAQINLQHSEEWLQWKSQHGKNYDSQRHELERHLVWLSNREYINAHNKNADIFGFTLAMNHFGDMTDKEYQEMYMTYQKNNKGNYTKVFDRSQYSSIPDSVDWRTSNAVTSVKYQGQCGASYAFSAVGALEGAWALAYGKLVTLSEQNVIDCSVPYGNYGCRGGNMHNAYQYIISNDGIDSEDSYPYAEYQSSCQYTGDGHGAQMSGSVSISSGSEDDLQSALAYIGPVSVAVDASNTAFRYYSGGVYSSTQCSSSSLGHAMLATGYGSYNGNKYYLVKNSWGKNWGINGYIKMTRNKYNQCGIATDASYPTL